jgi:hypothetical protein
VAQCHDHSIATSSCDTRVTRHLLVAAPCHGAEDGLEEARRRTTPGGGDPFVLARDRPDAWKRDGIVNKREAAGLKKLSRALVIALVGVVVLAAFNVSIPAGKSGASNWKFVLTHPTILLHVIVATGALVAAAVAVVVSLRSRDRSWIALSVAGLAFVLLAFAAGADYVMSLQKSALNYMSTGWAGAVIMYGAGWYLGRRKERREEMAHMPGG